MTRDRAIELFEPIVPSLRAAFPVRGIVVAPTGAGRAGSEDGDEIAVLLIIAVPLSHHVRMELQGEMMCDVFAEDEAGAVRAMETGVKDHIVRMLAGGTIVGDDDGVAARLQYRAREALGRPRPQNPLATLHAITEPTDLMRKLEAHRNEPVMAQLLYAQLLVALLRTRLTAEGCWAVPTVRLFDENRRIDPLLAGWVAVAARRAFNAEMLPALRQRVQQVIDLFPGHRDILRIA
jgi:hypothetical protein